MVIYFLYSCTVAYMHKPIYQVLAIVMSVNRELTLDSLFNFCFKFDKILRLQ